jgi:hypothetical protein
MLERGGGGEDGPNTQQLAMSMKASLEVAF